MASHRTVGALTIVAVAVALGFWYGYAAGGDVPGAVSNAPVSRLSGANESTDGSPGAPAWQGLRADKLSRADLARTTNVLFIGELVSIDDRLVPVPTESDAAPQANLERVYTFVVDEVLRDEGGVVKDGAHADVHWTLSFQDPPLGIEIKFPVPQVEIGERYAVFAWAFSNRGDSPYLAPIGQPAFAQVVEDGSLDFVVTDEYKQNARQRTGATVPADISSLRISDLSSLWDN